MKEKLFLVRTPYGATLFRDENKARKHWKALVEEFKKNVGVEEGYKYLPVHIEDSDMHYAVFKWITPFGDHDGDYCHLS